MKGDFTRSTWDRKKHYSSVRMQQGRVQVDADWNEQADILEHLRETEARDVIGPCGVPRDGGGFKVGLAAGGADLNFSAGRIYVDGILCEAERAFRYSQQAEFPDAPMPPDLGNPPDLVDGPYLVYLDVWRRHITALEDPEIRERALGGPDTATRAQVIRQVKLLRARFQDGVPPNCSQEEPEGWLDLIAPSSGRLRARTQAGVTETDPCIVPAQAGYTRLENQLYRVEVHRGGSLDTATFKWSRNNGTVVTEWLSQEVNELTVTSSGPDKLTGFHDARWVELTDDTRELQGLAGLLVRVSRVDGEVIEIDPEGQVVDRADFPLNPKIRRWDLPDTAGGAETITTPAANQGYLRLENGIEVRFETGEYRTGDFWTIPARAFVGEFAGEIEWPQEAPGQGEALPPEGIEHHYCKLGFVEFEGSTFTAIHTDCRPEFPTLTDLRRFYLAGGDGQQALPGSFLPCALRVAVSNGEFPVAGAKVAFNVPSTGGLLERQDGSLRQLVIAETDGTGIAQCRWQMPPQPPSPDSRPCLQATATLLEDGFATDLPPLAFSAEISEARNVNYDPRNCPPLQQAGANTVQAAIDELCQNLGSSNEPGIGIDEVRVLDSSVPVLNDGPLTAANLAQGLMILCDQDPAQAAFFKSEPDFIEPAKPNCIVTLDLPYPIGSDNGVWDIQDIIGFQPLVLRASVAAEGNRIVWQPHPATANWLSQTLFNRQLGPSGQTIDRFLCHLTLKGNFIWTDGVQSGENPKVYLDGDNFGAPKDGRVDARFPSGNGRPGGDFEMWFWLGQGESARPGGLIVDAGADGPDIFGSVSDKGGGRLPGVNLTLSSAVGILQTSTTNSAGSFAFRGLPTGSFTIEAKLSGMSGSRSVTIRPGTRQGIRDLPGVGEVFAKRLEGAGVSTVEEVAKQNTAGLAKILQISSVRAARILAVAKSQAKSNSELESPVKSRAKPRTKPAAKKPVRKRAKGKKKA